MRTRLAVICFALLLSVATPASSQSLAPALSGRATTALLLRPPQGTPPSTVTPVEVIIEYGQPHARGRVVRGALAADLDTIWRLGANEATALTTPVDLVIGTLAVPKGEYTLYAKTAATGEWMLIVNKRTKQWGTTYEASQDLGRTPLRSRALATPVESLTFWLIPAAEGSRGELRFAWGTREFTTDWRLR